MVPPMAENPLGDAALREVRRIAGPIQDLLARRVNLEAMERHILPLEVAECAYGALHDPSVETYPEFC